MGKIAESLIYSIHRGKWNGEDLIIDDARVKEHAEVLTPPNIVSDMLDLVSDEYNCEKGIEVGTLPIDKTFLEPSCGTGNFLVQILQRKLRLCKSRENIFNAVSSIYGVDIQKDNVLESRLRMLEIIEEIDSDEEFLTIISDVLEKNIIGGDTLEDKFGCSIDGVFVKGLIDSRTGCLKDDILSNDRGRLVVYKWNWNNGSPTKTAEFLIENEVDEPKVEKVETKSMTELMDFFKGVFSE